MKKIVSLFIIAFISITSIFATDMNIGLKGNLGYEAGDLSGAAFGGGAYANFDFYNGFGLQVELDLTACKMKIDDGLIVSNSTALNIPVMFWYNYKLDPFSFGGGLGINTSIASSKVKMTLASSLNAKWIITENFALVTGLFGSLDMFPTIKTTKLENATKFNFVKSDFTRNAFCGFFGVEYRIKDFSFSKNNLN